MKKAILCGLVILILTNIELKARSYFKDGFVITLNKDTIFGKIGYTSGFNNKSCFLRNESGTKEYTPDQILAYGFINDKYFSSRIIEGTFTEVLVEGYLSLFKSGYDFYVQKTDDELHKLESKQIRDTAMVKVEGGSERVIGYREDVRWKGILSVLTSDCIESSMTIQNMSLNEKKLRKFVIGYNLCKGNPYRNFKSGKT